MGEGGEQALPPPFSKVAAPPLESQEILQNRAEVVARLAAAEASFSRPPWNAPGSAVPGGSFLPTFDREYGPLLAPGRSAAMRRALEVVEERIAARRGAYEEWRGTSPSSRSGKKKKQQQQQQRKDRKAATRDGTSRKKKGKKTGYDHDDDKAAPAVFDLRIAETGTSSDSVLMDSLSDSKMLISHCFDGFWKVICSLGSSGGYL